MADKLLSRLLALWFLIILSLSLISRSHGLTVITTCTDLQAIQNDLGGSYQLGNDIDCSDTVNWNAGAGFEPLGINSTICFIGTFDGQGHKILNLFTNRPTEDNVGLFRYINSPAQINSVGIVGGFISGHNNVGSLAGNSISGKINNTYATGTVNGTNSIGGLVGINYGAITSAYATGAVNGINSVGGLVGYNSGTITSAYATGTVSGVSEVGGLIGRTWSSSKTSNAHATGKVFGKSCVGGLIGFNNGRNLDNSHATGAVNGTNSIGGLIGCNDRSWLTFSMAILNSYATGTVSGYSYVGGLVGYDSPGFPQTPANCEITNSYATGAVSGYSYVGGLVGSTSNLLSGNTISKAYATGVVNATSYVGGLVGSCSDTSITDAYATGAVTGSSYVAGLVGDASASSYIARTYAIGTVLGSSKVGGLVGYKDSAITITGSYWDTQTSRRSTSSGGTGRNTTQLHQQATYVGWDFTIIWRIDEGQDYPKLTGLTPPIQVANPIADQSIGIGQQYQFTIPQDTIADDQNSLITYTTALASGTALPLWLTFTFLTRTFSGTPFSGAQGSYAIQVTGTNTQGDSTYDIFTLTVTDRSPVQDHPLQSQTLGIGGTLNYAFAANTFSDPDFDPLSYSAKRQDGSVLPSWITFQSQARTFSGIPRSGAQGTQTIAAIASDGFGGSATGLFTITVTNRSPTVQTPIGTLTAINAQRFQWVVPNNIFADPDGDPLTYTVATAGGSALPVWLTFTTSNATLFGTPTQRATYNLQITANDGFGGQVTTTFILVIPNTAPAVANPFPNQDVGLDTPFTFSLPSSTFVDVDGDSMTHSARLSDGNSLPNWLSFAALTMTFSGTATLRESYSIEVIASDGLGGSGSLNFVLRVANQIPVVMQTIADQTGTINQLFALTISANTFTDADNDPLQYQAQQANGNPLPAWLSFTAATRTFSGTPVSGAQGTWILMVSVNDGFAGIAQTSFSLQIPNQFPVVAVPILYQRFLVGQSFVWAFPASTFFDPDGDVLQLSTSSLPIGLTFDAKNQTFSGQLANNQPPFMITIFANDGFGGSVSTTFNVSINHAPKLNGFISNQAATIGNPFLFTFAPDLFTDPDNDPLRYQAQQTDGNAIPSWLTFDSDSRTFMGIPKTGDQGFCFILLQALDPFGGIVSGTMGIAISDLSGNQPPMVTLAIPTQTAYTKIFFSFQFFATTFTDPNDDALLYAAELEGGSALPNWLTFASATRLFEGTPNQPGTLRISITANDGRGGLALTTFTLMVSDSTYYPPYVLNPIPQQIANVGERFSLIIPSDTFEDPNNHPLTMKVSEGGGPLPHWLKYDASTQTLFGTAGHGDTGLWGEQLLQIQISVNDGQGSAITSFDLFVRGDSYMLLAIKVLGPLATILGFLWGIYSNRAWLWSTLAKQWYELPPQYAIITQLYEWTAKLPKTTRNQSIYTIKVRKNGLELPNGKFLPNWLDHNTKIHQLKGTPQADDIDEFDVHVYGFDNRILAAFSLAVVNNQGEGDAFVRRINIARSKTISAKICRFWQTFIRCLPHSLQRCCLRSTKCNKDDKELALLDEQEDQ